jgi:hypothetical protein
MAEEEDLIFGIWTKEEFVDDVVFCLFGMLIGFLSAFGYKFISRYLDRHKWFKE